MTDIHRLGKSEPDDEDVVEPVRYRFDMTRRGFVQWLGAGIIVSVSGDLAWAQGRRGNRAPLVVSARLHIGDDGFVTVFTGKVEMGQDSRTEITQAAAEELRLSVAQVRLIMGDTDLVPNDGGTAGSRTTPSTIPDVRKGAAFARELLLDLAAKRLQASKESLHAQDGTITHSGSNKSVSYAELAQSPDIEELLRQQIPAEIQVTPVTEWRVMGVPVPKVDARAVVTGQHRYPSDIARPGMLYGKVLRAPAYGATLKSLDLAPAKAMEGVIAVHDGGFVGCAAPTSFKAGQAIEAVAKTAQWDFSPHPSSKELFFHLRAHARQNDNPSREVDVSVNKSLEEAAQKLAASYEIAYIQHVPLEPRAAVAEWNEGKLTVWTGTQQPNGVHEELAEAFSIPADKVRVIVPDTGGGFGGKHSGEVAIEAARLAKETGKPVSLRWTRAEEFTWAYFRPAGVIDFRAGLDAQGKLVAFEQINVNSGNAGIACPYRVPSVSTRHVPSSPPLRQGSYRALAATANNFARECFIDELASAAHMDPLEFRLAHIDEERLRNVLTAAATRFNWTPRLSPQNPESASGFGLACGTEKGSFVAACVEVRVDRDAGTIAVVRVCEAFECGPVLNPDNLRAQMEGCIIMGLGGALTEEIRFENGRLLNGSLRQYHVPRFKDVPPIELVVLDRKDISSVGAGETPIIAIAPAIANAVFDATGLRIRTLPMRGEAVKKA